MMPDRYSSMRKRRRRRAYAPLPEESESSGGVTPPPVGNVWSFSRDLTSSEWVKGQVVVTADALGEPARTSTADKVSELAGAGQHYISRRMEDARDGFPQVVTFYAKKGERRYLTVRSNGRGGLPATTLIDLADGTILRDPVEHVVEVQAMGQGWYWIKVRHLQGYMLAGTITPLWQFVLTENAAGNIQYTGVAGSGLYLWDLEYHPNVTGATLVPNYAVLPTSGASILRVGFMSSDDLMGLGPGHEAPSEGKPCYNVSLFVPNFSSIGGYLDLARDNDIYLVLNFARGRGQWFDANGNFDITRYKNNVVQWNTHTRVREFIEAGKIMAYVHDEPNHPQFKGTLTPSLVNDCGLYHKELWPGILTCVRANGETFTDGWAGYGKPRDGYTGIDYGWMQFGPQHSPAGTIAATYASHKALFSALNMGMITGLNYYDGGNTTLVEGVQPCWDYEGNKASSGYIAGSSDNVFPRATLLNCGDSRVTSATNVVCSPAWVKKAIDTAITDPDSPFFLMWQHAHETNTVNTPYFIAMEARADIVAGLRYAINKGLTRTAFNGLRTAK